MLTKYLVDINESYDYASSYSPNHADNQLGIVCYKLL